MVQDPSSARALVFQPAGKISCGSGYCGGFLVLRERNAVLQHAGDGRVPPFLESMLAGRVPLRTVQDERHEGAHHYAGPSEESGTEHGVDSAGPAEVGIHWVDTHPIDWSASSLSASSTSKVACLAPVSRAPRGALSAVRSWFSCATSFLSRFATFLGQHLRQNATSGGPPSVSCSRHVRRSTTWTCTPPDTPRRKNAKLYRCRRTLGLVFRLPPLLLPSVLPGVRCRGGRSPGGSSSQTLCFRMGYSACGVPTVRHSDSAASVAIPPAVHLPCLPCCGHGSFCASSSAGT